MLLKFHTDNCKETRRSCLRRRGLRISPAGPPEFDPTRRWNFTRRRRRAASASAGLSARAGGGAGRKQGRSRAGAGRAGRGSSRPRRPGRRGRCGGRGEGEESGAGRARVRVGWPGAPRGRPHPQCCRAAFNTFWPISLHLNTSHNTLLNTSC